MTAIPDALGRVNMLLEQTWTDLERVDAIRGPQELCLGALYDATVALQYATEELARVVADLASLLGARP